MYSQNQNILNIYILLNIYLIYLIKYIKNTMYSIRKSKQNYREKDRKKYSLLV